MKKLVFGLIVCGLTTHMFAQEITLDEIQLFSNHNYFTATNTEQVALPVKKLEDQVLDYKADKSDFKYDKGEIYNVTFSIPEGKIIAAYNDEGKLVSTIEKYTNVRLPSEVIYAILERFPKWAIMSNTYYVNFHREHGITKKLYKIEIVNDDKSLDIKTDEQGNFI
jgi:hypothetical protein